MLRDNPRASGNAFPLLQGLPCEQPRGVSWLEQGGMEGLDLCCWQHSELGLTLLSHGQGAGMGWRGSVGSTALAALPGSELELQG